MRVIAALSSEVATYELGYTCMTNRKGTWKNTRFVHTFATIDRKAAIEEAKKHWAFLHERLSHRLLAFDSLLVRHSWHPITGPVLEPMQERDEKIPERRTFLIRFKWFMRGINGPVHSIRQKMYVVATDRTAYKQADAVWQALLNSKHAGDCKFLALYERLDWKPE